MADILLNKQVNVWRGSSEPPTIYHVWISDNQTLKLHDGKQWQTFLDNPGLSISTNTDGSIKIANGETYFTLAVEGSALSIRRNDSDIVIKSTALNTIPTDEWLTWANNKLSHNDIDKTKATEIYGPKTDIDSSSFTVPSIEVDSKGHVVNGTSKTITIPDRVVQNELPQNESGDYPVILAGTTAPTREVGEVNKDTSLSMSVTYKGGETIKTLVTPGINAKGDVNIQGNIVVPEGYTIKGTIVGNVSGTATPTNHADPTDRYGLGTSASNDGTEALYGHVKLQDELPTTEPPSGNIKEGMGIAATPLMVYKAMQEVDSKFSSDFTKETDGKFYLNWED